MRFVLLSASYEDAVFLDGVKEQNAPITPAKTG
jgi:hypothetical protein